LYGEAGRIDSKETKNNFGGKDRMKKRKKKSFLMKEASKEGGRLKESQANGREGQKAEH